MQTRILATRVYKTEPDALTNEISIKKSKILIDFAYVVDYEEYVGDIKDMQGFKNKNMTTVYFEYALSSEYKVVMISFEEFHKMREDYIKWCETNEGIIKLN